MIISPPFLPALGPAVDGEIPLDPMMDAVDRFESAYYGIYPIAFDRRWHGGVHLTPKFQNEPVRAIADGEVVAYRVSQKPITDGGKNVDGSDALNSNTGFVLLKHTTDTGNGRTIVFYSLYMHLLDLQSIRQRLGPLSKGSPAIGSSTVLPNWLAYPTEGVQVPQDKKVYRKDILGYTGACHGQPHLHFEIFMTDAEFEAAFEKPGHRAQLGNENPATPASNDYWGHTYYVVPGSQAFLKAPQGLTSEQSAYFPPLQDGMLDARSTLYVEAYFHKGQRYTRAWMASNGTIKLLTPEPVEDAYKDYEYKMYARATALYPRCPSDGYELLRFGRILCDQPTLDAQTTWVAMPFEAGKQGYIDIGSPRVQKLSDADFPFFMGWRKLDERTTPFDQDGLCDLDELRKIVAVAESTEASTTKALPVVDQAARLAAYVRGNAKVRESLRGFICHAPSEWDARNNAERYGRLNDPGEFFGKRKETDPDGYKRFIRLQEQFQFLDETALGSHKKFWFFHPLAFIRHFRRCGWLSAGEFSQIYAESNFRAVGKVGEDYKRRYGRHLNVVLRKYLLNEPLRCAHFLGQCAIESFYMMVVRESGVAIASALKKTTFTLSRS